ncbi:MAG: hypothetical protein AAF549_03125 [Pseudomonadota bacterium]
MTLKKSKIIIILTIITLSIIGGVYLLNKEEPQTKSAGEILREQRANSEEKLKRLRESGEQNDEALRRWGM